MSNTDLGEVRVRRRWGRLVPGFVAILAIAVGMTAVPGAAAAATPVRAPVLDIAVTPDGVSAPVLHSSGVISFRVTTTVTGEGSNIGLARLRPGTGLETFATHLGQVFSEDRATGVAAARALMAEADLIGGVRVQPGQPGMFTAWLRPGTYYLFDYAVFDSPPPAGPEALHELTISEDRHGGFPPIPRSTVWSLDSPSGPVFLAPSRISASQPILFTNLLDQVNEAMFFPVHPEATGADVQAFFEFLEGGPPAPAPFVGPPVGIPPIAPGRISLVQLGLAPGRYALVTFVFDVDDGVGLAVKGMHRFVDVTR